ncbi:MAG: phosphoribosylanthranilate isomerase [Cocleimonas sp.]|nr:phosphoribosylanthranilate isomerase [Cocleimonas sp.]
MTIRTKICGITSIEDALNACNAGADALGLVFYAKSPRNVSSVQAAEICNAIPPFVTTVGLFLDATKDFVNEALEIVPLDLLQFHGSESPEYCASFNHPYIKAVGMKEFIEDGDVEASFKKYADQYPDAQGFLVDSHGAGKAGGTGEAFNWNKIPQGIDKPIILAGGLNPENISEAIQTADSIYGVDLSSGVESAPGIKDKQKIEALMKNIRMSEVRRVQC